MLFNQALGRGPVWANLMRRLLGQANAPQIAPEIAPEFTIENDRPEWAYLKGEALRIGRNTVAAGGAGVRSISSLRNPAGSGLLFVIENITAATAAGQTVFIAYPNVTPMAGLADTLTARSRDTRLAGATQFTAGRIFSATVAIPAAIVIYANATANLVYDQPIILGPGSEIFCAPFADNQNLECTFTWRERPLFEMEA